MCLWSWLGSRMGLSWPSEQIRASTWFSAPDSSGPEQGSAQLQAAQPQGAGGTGRGQGADWYVFAGPLTGPVWRGGGLRPRFGGTLAGLGCGFLDQSGDLGGVWGGSWAWGAT